MFSGLRKVYFRVMDIPPNNQDFVVVFVRKDLWWPVSMQDYNQRAALHIWPISARAVEFCGLVARDPLFYGLGDIPQSLVSENVRPFRFETYENPHELFDWLEDITKKMEKVFPNKR